MHSQLMPMEKKSAAIHVRLEPDIKDLVEKVAKGYGLSVADFARIAIRSELQRLGYFKEGLVSLRPLQVQVT